jgi:hypothetical protein
MNFYLVLSKSRKKIDKYIKVNRISKKVIIDIKLAMEENDIQEGDKFMEYFNVMIFTRITQALNKEKDVYYIPNFSSKRFDVKEIFKIKKILKEGTSFNILMFFDEFKDDVRFQNEVLTNITLFDKSQIIKDY